ncbi:MAG: T9SS type A sorting domain-containing protein [Chitinophagaceae bacterium]|nr:MAG: T9SS type A sorting domain-containing protein [Chitinophagaceae bacterium]
MKRFILSTFLLVSVAASAGAQASRTAFGNEPATVLRFYPNPAVSNITFDFSRSFDKGYTLQVYNFLGRKMYESVNISQRTSINLNDYNRGVYIYQLYDRAGKMVESGKFQVSK